MNVRVRKETVRCLECGNINDLYYLSDFSYGEKLIIYDEGRKYAFINLFEDEIYDEFKKLVHEIVEENGENIEDAGMIDLFEMTCDRIDGCTVSFRRTKRKCCFCDSYVFETRLLEPEALVNIDVPMVTHKIWKQRSDMQKREMVEEFLQNSNIIREKV